MSHKSLIILGSLAFSALFSCQGKNTEGARLNDAWNRVNDPALLGDIYDRSYATLPKNGRLDTAPWSDTYWPSSKGGIATRWQSPEISAWDYHLNSADEVKKMSQAAIAALSPAEKWDIYTGNYSYPTVASERARVSSSAPAWEGLCHAWAPAALLYQEPKPIIATNDQGTKISFGSSDIKAMIILALHLNPPAAGFAGSRCYKDGGTPGPGSQDPCNDMNAGSFHIMLANLVRSGQPGIVIDVTREAEVWNQPVYAYDVWETGRHGPSNGAAAGTVTEIEIENRIEYGAEIEANWTAVVGTERNYIASKLYKYRLELDAKNQIIGGEWLQTDRPDFAWRHTQKSDLATLTGPTGNYTALDNLWKKSIGQGTGPVVVPPVVVPPVVVPPVVVPPVVVPPAISECKILSRVACLAAAPSCRYVDAVPGITDVAECQKNWNQ